MIMSISVLPFIGESGVYTLIAPFDTIIDTNARYTCQAIRTISDYLSENKKVYEEIYKPVGIDEDTYNQDAKDNISIVSLQSNAGHWVTVPANYILKYPDTNGVPYSNRIMSFAFPGIPDSEATTMSYEALAAEISDIIKARTGITTNSSFRRVSRINYVSQEDHQSVIDQRETERSAISTTYAQLLDAQAHISLLNAKIAQLTAFIANR